MSASKFCLATVSVAAMLVATSAQGANFTVLDGEIWDGTENPHAADGVVLTNVGNAYTYTIPFQMTIDGGATLFLRDPSTFGGADPVVNGNDRSITFNFTGAGNAGMAFTDGGSRIDAFKGTRSQTTRAFTLNMNNNPIAGDFGSIHSFNYVGGPNENGPSVDSFAIVINSQSDITLGTVDGSHHDTAARNVNITTTGDVDIDVVNAVDRAGGGGNGGTINITAASMKLGDMATYGLRPSSAVSQGVINLRALAQPANSTGNFAGNTVAANTITLDGFIDQDKTTQTAIYDDPGGTVNLNAAKVTLESSFAWNPNMTSNGTQVGTFTINTGRVETGFTKAQMFINDSGVAFSETTGLNRVNYTVFHDGFGPAAVAWAANNSGNWLTDGNWTPGVAANSGNTVATIGANVTSPQTMFLDANAKVKGLVFDTAPRVAIAGAAQLSMESISGNATIAVNQGAPEIQTQVNLISNTDVTVATGTSLDVTGIMNLNGKTLNISGAGTVNLTNSVTGVGTVTNSATLGTGGATGLVGTLNSTGTLAIDVGGTGTNSFDSWAVTGAATLSGTLSVDAVGGFTPSGGQNFTVLTTTGALSAASLTLGGPDAGLFTLVKNANSLVLQSIGGGAVAGDFNNNGVVDAADYVLWRNGGPLQNEGGITPGATTPADYTFWRSRFGATSASGSVAGSSVPEPTSSVLVLLAGLAMAATGRRRS